MCSSSLISRLSCLYARLPQSLTALFFRLVKTRYPPTDLSGRSSVAQCQSVAGQVGSSMCSRPPQDHSVPDAGPWSLPSTSLSHASVRWCSLRPIRAFPWSLRRWWPFLPTGTCTCGLNHGIAVPRSAVGLRFSAVDKFLLSGVKWWSLSDRTIL